MSNQKRERRWGEQEVYDATVPYAGGRRSINCTVNAKELQEGIAKQKAEFRKRIQEHEEYKRVKKGKRVTEKMLPSEEKYSKNGSITIVRPITKTTREEH